MEGHSSSKQNRDKTPGTAGDGDDDEDEKDEEDEDEDKDEEEEEPEGGDDGTVAGATTSDGEDDTEGITLDEIKKKMEKLQRVCTWHRY